MSLEKDDSTKRLHDQLTQLERDLTHIPHQETKAGKRRRDKVVEQMVAVVINFISAGELEAWQKAATELDARGCDVLRINGAEARTISWFEETGRALATGDASRCVVFALIDRKMGMAASHVNILNNKPIIKIWIEASLEARGSFANQRIDFPEVLSPNLLKQPISSAFYRTANEFRALWQGNLPPSQSRVEVLGIGLNFLTPKTAQEMAHFVKQIACTRPALFIEKGELSTRPTLGFDLRFGCSGGIVWGPQHPSYSEPSFYLPPES